MKTALIFDSFKGCMSSQTAGESAALGLADIDKSIEAVVIATADGGEGMAEAVLRFGIGDVAKCHTCDPLLRPIDACYTIDVRQRRAFIDLASAAGITLLAGGEKNPMKATTFGLGTMISDAVARGAEDVYIGLGGSATNDCATGAMQAIGVKFFDRAGRLITAAMSGERLADVGVIDVSAALQTRFHLLCDIDNPLCGERGAAAVFAPQKGASPAMCRSLETGVRHFVEMVKKCGFIDKSEHRGAGAAGGAGFGFASLLGADILPGAETLFDLTDVEGRTADCDLIITGEGSGDAQTLMGKLPSKVLALGRKHDIPVLLMCGKVADEEQLLQAGFAGVIDINCSVSSGKFAHPAVGENPLDPAVATRRLRQSVSAVIARIKNEQSGRDSSRPQYPSV